MNKKPTYIIEHLEPKLFEWCMIEYKHISKLIGGRERLWFTNISNNKDAAKLKKLGRVFKNSVKDFNLKNSCVLDPESSRTLSPSERFKYYIFGGILGDYPPKKRTRKELTRFMPAHTQQRNIGKEQMSTDNAVFTVMQIAEKKKKLSQLKFKDKISLKLNEFESVDLPYRYNLVEDKGGKKPFMSPEITSYLKKKKGF